MSLRPFLAIILLVLAAAPCARAQDNSAIEAKLKPMEDLWAKALKDKDQAAVGNMVADDYAGMITDGLFFEAPPSFAALLEHCDAIQQRANQMMA